MFFLLDFFSLLFFRNRSVNRTQILQEFFPTSSLLSFPKTVSLENCFLIRHPDLGNKVRNSSWSYCLPVCELSFRSCRPFGDLHAFSSFHRCVMWHLKVAVPPRTGEKVCCVYLYVAGTSCPPLSAVRNAFGCPSSSHLCPGLCAQLDTIHLRGNFVGAVPGSKFYPFWNTCNGDISQK